MSIEVTNRGFVLAIPNDTEKMHLHIRCSENHLTEMARFIRFADLGFRELRGDNYVTNAHKVSSSDGVVEAPNGKIFFEILDGVIHFKPLNGSIRGYEFTVSVDEMAQTLVRESNQSRWDDYCLGKLDVDGQVVCVFNHLLLDNILTITDQRSYYMTVQNEGLNWRLGEFYITKEKWYEFAEKFRRRDGHLPPHEEPVYGWMHTVLRASKFTSVAHAKQFFNVV